MRVTALEVTNFRNYAALRFEPASGVCVLVGQNAQGKSNLLECLSLLSTGKSFRAAREVDLIKTGAPVARVAASVQTRAGEVQAACIITRAGEGARKKFLRNGRSVSYAQFLGGIAAVTFMPFDLQLIAGPPALRRRFLNTALSQAGRQYYHQHATYLQVLLQKNAALKGPGPVDVALMQTYNEQLAEAGSQIIAARAAYVRRVSQEAAAVHARWVGAAEELTIAYQPSPDISDETPAAILRSLQVALSASAAAEVMRKTSLVGPHRDELSFTVAGASLARFGSQGQQRTAVLALKAAEYALLAQATGEPPLLLLDDVLSELDAERRRAFLANLGHLEQAFMTSADMPELPSQSARVYQIADGHIADLPFGARLSA